MNANMPSTMKISATYVGHLRTDLSVPRCVVEKMSLRAHRLNWEPRQTAQGSCEQSTASRLADEIRTRQTKASDL